MPEMDAVLAITSGCNDMQGILDLVWEHLLPAMEENVLPEDEEAYNRMTNRMDELVISTLDGTESSCLAEKLRGKVFHLEPGDMGIESIRFDRVSFPGKLTVTAGGLAQSFQVGFDSYEKGILRYPDLVSDKIATCGAWQTPEKLVINTIYYETPHAIMHTIRFSDDGMLWERELNAGFGQKKLETLKGYTE
jgi:hypothetical protein